MTASEVRAARTAGPSLTIRARDVLAGEWTKLRSVRSNYWTLLIAAILAVGSASVVARTLANGPVPRLGTGPLTPLTESFLGYAEYAVISVGVLSILTFTSEYATGMIRTTFVAVPRRWAVLAARAAVAGAVALVAGELLAFAAFFLTQAILSGRHGGISLSHPGVPGAVLAAGGLLAVSAVLGLGLGVIIRHTAAPSRP